MYLIPKVTQVNFENATISVELCRDVLVRSGYSEEARRLRGLEVSSLAGAEVALDVLKGISPSTEDAQAALALAICAVQGALRPVAA